MAYKPPPISSFYSPKRPTLKEFSSSTTTPSIRSEINTPKQQLSQEEVTIKGRAIFNENMSTPSGVT